MLQTKSLLACWGVGLTQEQQNVLQKHIGSELPLEFWTLDDLPTLRQVEKANPCILWLSTEANNAMEQMPQAQVRHLANIPKVLFLGETYSLQDFETACDSGISEIVRPPLTEKRVFDITRRAMEIQLVQRDICCMTREILLERELLERKNELLTFLVKFLANTTESLDLEYILQTAYDGLGILLPLRAMHVALWELGEKDNPSISLHICSPENSRSHEEWREELLEHVRNSVGTNFAVEEIQHLKLLNPQDQCEDLAPADLPVISLPIMSGAEQLGVVLLVAEVERHLGRDQVTALSSAMHHFALSIKNARRFHRIQLHADYDSLTRVHSRRHFEGRLEEEMCRFTRYHEPLSMIMLDIDHFKSVNDTYGHHVGDLVLREVGGLMATAIRTTDYCARYGGEEFAVLLPHTDAVEAFRLAERLRNIIADTAFNVIEGEPLSITISLGVATLTPHSQKNKQALICEADAALYAAKAAGRNCTKDSETVLATVTTHLCAPATAS